jgi:hypothetical protein
LRKRTLRQREEAPTKASPKKDEESGGEAKRAKVFVADADSVCCGDCWLARASKFGDVWQSRRSGLVHTLFAYSDLWRRVWSLWTRHFTVASSGAHRADSLPMQRLRDVLEAHGIGWAERCAAFARPFDRAHRGPSDEARRRPMGASELTSAPWFDANVGHALVVALGALLGVEHSYEGEQRVLGFYNNVVAGAIVYLHEAGVRRAAELAVRRRDGGSGEPSRVSLAALEAEFIEGRAADAVYSYATLHGFASAARTCPELAALGMRADASGDFSVTVLLNEVRRTAHTMPAYVAEQRCCAVLRTVPIAAEYVWPHQLGVAAPMKLALARGDDGSWTTCLAPVVVAETPAIAPPPVGTPDANRRRLFVADETASNAWEETVLATNCWVPSLVPAAAPADTALLKAPSTDSELADVFASLSMPNERFSNERLDDPDWLFPIGALDE